FRFDGQILRVVVAHNAPQELREWVERNPTAPGRHCGVARAALERRTIHIHDVRTDPEYTRGARKADPQIRTVLAIPMLRGHDLLGVTSFCRHEVLPFTDSQIALMETFAAQAVIAIENVRLFRELGARNRELSAALERETASADLLRIIAASPTDLTPVF